MTSIAFFVVKLYVSLLLSFPRDLHSTCASYPPYSFHIVLPCVPSLQNGERGFKATSPTGPQHCLLLGLDQHVQAYDLLFRAGRS